MFKERKGKKSQLPSQCFIKENKNTETFFFWGGGLIIREFSLFAGWGDGLGTQPPAQREDGIQERPQRLIPVIA